MGKRKKAKKVTPQKRVYKIPKLFPCPFCLKKDGIKITMERRADPPVASLQCRGCGIGDESIPIRSELVEPVDIYTDWMDQVHEANEKYNRQREPVDDEIDDRRERDDGYSRRRNISDDDRLSTDDSDSDSDSDVGNRRVGDSSRGSSSDLSD